ncbi:serine hydrolase domain-containing protein [Gymnodinialimonas sp.]
MAKPLAERANTAMRTLPKSPSDTTIGLEALVKPEIKQMSQKWIAHVARTLKGPSRCTILGTIFAVLFLSLSLKAQEAPQVLELPGDTIARPDAEPVPSLIADPDLLAAFVDTHFGGQFEEENIAGGAFVAIRGGEVLFSRAYGVSDIETGVPVAIETSMFHVASISKTFLGTAIMRLVDQGVVSLDDELAEIAPSLGLDAFIRFPERPVTLRDVLTHRSGFRDILMNGTAPDAGAWERVRDAIPRYLEPQAVPAGTYYYYCNICISMAAVVIEDQTGLAYEDYLQQEVFDPLGMDFATLLIPGNPRATVFADHLVTPYFFDDETGAFEAQDLFIRNVYPASSVAVSAEAMGNYMAMHLGGGMFDGQSYLTEPSAHEMHSHQGSNHELIPGYRISFKEGQRNGVVYYGHSGDYRGNDSTMMFLPEYDFGFFVTYTGDNDTFYREFINLLFDEAFPRQTEEVAVLELSADDLSAYAGTYTNFRYDEATPMQVVFPLMGQFEVEAREDGRIALSSPSFFFSGGTAIYAPVSETLFRRVGQEGDGGIPELLVDYLVFHEDENGDFNALSTSVQNHSITLTRIPFWKSTSNFMVLMAFAAGGMLLIVLSMPASAMYRAFRKRKAQPSATNPNSSEFRRPLVLSIFGAALFGLIFLGGFFYVLFTTRPINLSYGLDDLGLNPFFILPLLSAVLTVSGAAFLLRAWAAETEHPIARVAGTLALLPLIAWCFIMWNGNLLTYYL